MYIYDSSQSVIIHDHEMATVIYHNVNLRSAHNQIQLTSEPTRIEPPTNITNLLIKPSVTTARFRKNRKKNFL